MCCMCASRSRSSLVRCRSARVLSRLPTSSKTGSGDGERASGGVSETPQSSSASLRSIWSIAYFAPSITRLRWSGIAEKIGIGMPIAIAAPSISPGVASASAVDVSGLGPGAGAASLFAQRLWRLPPASALPSPFADQRFRFEGGAATSGAARSCAAAGAALSCAAAGSALSWVIIGCRAVRELGRVRRVSPRLCAPMADLDKEDDDEKRRRKKHRRHSSSRREEDADRDRPRRSRSRDGDRGRGRERRRRDDGRSESRERDYSRARDDDHRDRRDRYYHGARDRADDNRERSPSPRRDRDERGRSDRDGRNGGRGYDEPDAPGRGPAPHGDARGRDEPMRAPPPPPPPLPSSGAHPPPPPQANMDEEEDGALDEGEAQLAMMRAMGIPVGFDTTKGKHVEDERCHESGVLQRNKREARQFMNRLKGGLIRGDTTR